VSHCSHGIEHGYCSARLQAERERMRSNSGAVLVVDMFGANKQALAVG